jgi:hypothetical protein
MDHFDMWDTSMLPKKGDTAFVHYYHEPEMKRVARADAEAHAAWKRIFG